MNRAAKAAKEIKPKILRQRGSLAGAAEDVWQVDVFGHLQNAVVENRSHDFGDGLVVVKTQNPQRLRKTDEGQNEFHCRAPSLNRCRRR